RVRRGRPPPGRARRGHGRGASHEYVWLDDMPVAMIDSTGSSPVTYCIHTGQIEEPLVMTDAGQNKVWDAYVEPFGQATVFGSPSAGLDLRLPGQFTQAETGGLSQNWNRDYDPSLGRYIAGAISTEYGCSQTRGSKEACVEGANTRDLSMRFDGELWKLVDHYRMCSWEHDTSGEGLVLAELIKRGEARAMYERGIEYRSGSAG